MKPVYVPNYYHRFKCIASACHHSCCVGWEIDVDGEALRRYEAVGGELGQRLRAGIDREACPPCFILDEKERCPFLNKDGLCDIIIELGEDALCRICADHPRFRNEQNDRVELGLGLCCEAAATLILGQTEPMQIIRLPDAEAARERTAFGDPTELDPVTEALRNVRDTVMAVIQLRTHPLGDRIRRICRSLSIRLPDISYVSWASFLDGMERLDPLWDTHIRSLSTLDGGIQSELDGENDPAYEQLVVYFLYRYMTAENDGRAYVHRVRVAFAILSAILIHAITRATGKDDMDTLAEIARLYSSEIEYSEENVERFFDLLEEAYI